MENILKIFQLCLEIDKGNYTTQMFYTGYSHGIDVCVYEKNNLRNLMYKEVIMFNIPGTVERAITKLEQFKQPVYA